MRALALILALALLPSAAACGAAPGSRAQTEGTAASSEGTPAGVRSEQTGAGILPEEPARRDDAATEDGAAATADGESATAIVALPQSASDEGEPRQITVAIDGEGQVYIDGQPTRLEDIAEFGGAVAVIAADSSTSYGRVVEVMDALRQAGIHRFSIAARRPPE